MSGPVLGVVSKEINWTLSLVYFQAVGETSAWPQQCGNASGVNEGCFGARRKNLYPRLEVVEQGSEGFLQVTLKLNPKGRTG